MRRDQLQEFFKAIAAATGSSNPKTDGNHFNVDPAPAGDAWVQVLPRNGQVWFGLAIDAQDPFENLKAKLGYERRMGDFPTPPEWQAWAPSNPPKNWYIMQQVGAMTEPLEELAAKVATAHKRFKEVLDPEEELIG